MLSTYSRRLSTYLAHPDPLTAATNLIAFIVGANGPFYPLYAMLLIGFHGASTFFTMLSSPFFLAIPALSKRSDLAGRIALPIVGTLNTLWCAKLLGLASGVELFLLPCITIAALSFRPRERLFMLPLTGLPMGLYLWLHHRYGPPLLDFNPEQYAALLSLNVASTGTLTAFLGLVYAKALSSSSSSRMG